jgi:hypothetical protein
MSDWIVTLEAAVEDTQSQSTTTANRTVQVTDFTDPYVALESGISDALSNISNALHSKLTDDNITSLSVRVSKMVA